MSDIPLSPEKLKVLAAALQALSPHGNPRFGGNTFGGQTFGGNQFGASAPPRAAPTQGVIIKPSIQIPSAPTPPPVTAMDFTRAKPVTPQPGPGNQPTQGAPQIQAAAPMPGAVPDQGMPPIVDQGVVNAAPGVQPARPDVLEALRQMFQGKPVPEQWRSIMGEMVPNMDNVSSR